MVNVTFTCEASLYLYSQDPRLSLSFFFLSYIQYPPSTITSHILLKAKNSSAQSLRWRAHLYPYIIAFVHFVCLQELYKALPLLISVLLCCVWEKCDTICSKIKCITMNGCSLHHLIIYSLSCLSKCVWFSFFRGTQKETFLIMCTMVALFHSVTIKRARWFHSSRRT